MENKFGFLLDIMFSTTPLPLNTLFNVEIQYSLQLADTVGEKKLSANWEVSAKCPPFGKFFNIGNNFKNKAFFYIYKV